MKPVLTAMILLLLSGAVLGVTAPEKPASRKADTFKLNTHAISEGLAVFTETPGWINLCETDCEQGKQFIEDVLCSANIQANGKTNGPLTPLLGTPDPKNGKSLATYSKKCKDIIREVVLDCALMKKGRLSCKPLNGCEKGGFYLRLDKAKIKKYTGYAVKQPAFIRSDFFKKLHDKKYCPTTT